MLPCFLFSSWKDLEWWVLTWRKTVYLIIPLRKSALIIFSFEICKSPRNTQPAYEIFENTNTQIFLTAKYFAQIGFSPIAGGFSARNKNAKKKTRSKTNYTGNVFRMKMSKHFENTLKMRGGYVDRDDANKLRKVTLVLLFPHPPGLLYYRVFKEISGCTPSHLNIAK